MKRVSRYQKSMIQRISLKKSESKEDPEDEDGQLLSAREQHERYSEHSAKQKMEAKNKENLRKDKPAMHELQSGLLSEVAPTRSFISTVNRLDKGHAVGDTVEKVAPKKKEVDEPRGPGYLEPLSPSGKRRAPREEAAAMSPTATMRKWSSSTDESKKKAEEDDPDIDFHR